MKFSVMNTLDLLGSCKGGDAPEKTHATVIVNKCLFITNNFMYSLFYSYTDYNLLWYCKNTLISKSSN